MLMRKTGNRTPPWRFSTDLPKALLDTLIAGIGYLLYVAFPNWMKELLLNLQQYDRGHDYECGVFLVCSRGDISE